MELEFKGTKGPWVSDESYVWTEAEGVFEDVVCLCPDKYMGSYNNWDANAKLIASAPELYNELKMLYLSIKGGGDIVSFSDSDINRIGKLLNKALNGK